MPLLGPGAPPSRQRLIRSGFLHSDRERDTYGRARVADGEATRFFGSITTSSALDGSGYLSRAVLWLHCRVQGRLRWGNWEPTPEEISQGCTCSCKPSPPTPRRSQ